MLLNTATKISVGNTNVQAIYKGGTKVWPPAGSSWTPDQLAGIQVWYDATDAATINSIGGEVSSWNDKSGWGRNVYLAGGVTNKPLTGTRTLNGKNVLDFSSTQLQSYSWDVPLGQPFTVFVVAKSDITGGANVQLIGYPAPTVYMNGGVWSLYAGDELKATTNVDSNPHVITSVFDHFGSGSTIRLDGALLSTTGAAGYAGFTIMYVSGASANVWDGYVAEIIIYSGNLSTTDKQTVESYLKTKWGTP